MKISCAIFLAAFFLLRPLTMQTTGSWYPDDDHNYFARASALCFGQFPSYKKEDFPGLQGAGMQSSGPGILAAPFVFVFSFLDRAEGSDIAEQRTPENITASWSQFGFVFSSVFYFCLACGLLYRALSVALTPCAARWSVILMAVCQGMPLYAFRRPIFTHMPEFLLQSIFVWLFLKNEMSSGRYVQRWWAYALLGAGAALIFLTRYNNILFAVVWPLLFIFRKTGKAEIKVMISRLFYTFIPFVLVVAVFELWPDIYNHCLPYSRLSCFLTAEASGQDILKRIAHIFIGADWGLCYTAPFMLVGILSLVFLNVPFKKRLVLASLPLLVNFYIIIVYGSQDDWYGYRLLMASAFPLFVLPLAFLLHQLDEPRRRPWKWGLVLLAVLPVMSMWGFEQKNTNLSLIFQSFGRWGYGHATYQLTVWRTLFDPQEWSFAFRQGGVQYFCYLFYKALIFLKVPFGYSLDNRDFLFQSQVLAFTVPFQLKILVRVLLIYSLPFLTGWALREKGKLSQG